MKDLYSLSLNDIAPPNILEDPQVSSLITALDPELQSLSRASLEPLILARIDELPEPVIDLLAWQLHADFYDLAATLSMKRKAVKNSLLWHMHKGTEWAIHEALKQIDISAKFIHWHDEGAQPYTFRLDAIVTGDFYRTQGAGKLQASIRRAVEESKAARSLMTDLDIRIEFKEETGLYVATIPLLSGNRRLGIDTPASPGRTQIYAGTASGLQGQYRIKLPHEPDIQTRVYIAPVRVINNDINLGVNLDIMQELLQKFESRILSRIDQYETKTMTILKAQQEELNLRIDEVIDMLRWKGDDEEL